MFHDNSECSASMIIRLRSMVLSEDYCLLAMTLTLYRPSG